MPRNRHRSAARATLVTPLLLTVLLLAACGPAAGPKTYTIGVMNYDAILTPVLDGFKTKMAALGYAEGQRVTYVYHGVLQPDPQVVEREVERLKGQRIDLLLRQPPDAAGDLKLGTEIPSQDDPAATVLANSQLLHDRLAIADREDSTKLFPALALPRYFERATTHLRFEPILRLIPG